MSSLKVIGYVNLLQVGFSRKLTLRCKSGRVLESILGIKKYRRNGTSRTWQKERLAVVLANKGSADPV